MEQAKDLMALGFRVNKKLLVQLSPHHPRTQFTAFSPSICPSGWEGGGTKLKGIGSERICLNLLLHAGDRAFTILISESASPFSLSC